MINLNTNKSISIVYVACTILVGAFYCFPQLRILIRFDQLAYLTALYYLCFVAKYVSFNQVVNLMKYAIPFCLLMFVDHVDCNSYARNYMFNNFDRDG